MSDETADAARAFARLVAALERQRPLCPDHRDKAKGYPCLLCEIERLRAGIQEAVEAFGHAPLSDTWWLADGVTVYEHLRLLAARAAGGGND